MSLKSIAGMAVVIALAATPALACKGRNVAFSDDFAVEDASWTATDGEFSVSGGRGQLRSEPDKIASVLNSGDAFESGDACLDVIAPNYRSGQWGGMLFNTNLSEGSIWGFVLNPVEGTAAVIALKKGQKNLMFPVNWRPVDSIKRQANATNTLRITIRNNKATTYINDKSMAAFSVNPAVSPALFGFIASTDGGIWQFDNFKITD
jgi:hypothetical protein